MTKWVKKPKVFKLKIVHVVGLGLFKGSKLFIERVLLVGPMHVVLQNWLLPQHVGTIHMFILELRHV